MRIGVVPKRLENLFGEALSCFPVPALGSDVGDQVLGEGSPPDVIEFEVQIDCFTSPAFRRTDVAGGRGELAGTGERARPSCSGRQIGLEC